MRKIFTSLLTFTLLCVSNAFATPVKVVMNSTSATMSLVNKATSETVNVGEPDSKTYTYSFDAQQGTYVLTAYAKGSTTVNGTIEVVVPESAEDQEFKVFTNTVYATNKDWVVDNDYTIEVKVCSREGEFQTITLGNSTTAGRKTFLAFNGNSYYAELIPSATHQEEGYMTLFKSATLTGGVNVNGAIPMGADYSITLPANAGFFLGTKGAHFTNFNEVVPKNTVENGATKTLTFRLANSQVYNYRTWIDGGLTQGGYFTMNTDESKRPQISFTESDYQAFAPKTIKHDVQWNQGYETGDIFVNINEKGYLKLQQGETFDLHAMRTWQLTDNSTNNYFIEPDFHYTIVGLDGQPLNDVISITPYDNGPWAKVEALKKGTALVLVTYDAIGLNYYSGTTKNTYLGGEYWSAIWPENTAAFVVSVDETEATVTPNMFINEEYNSDTKKNSGKFVDAEHDVFYYLDSESGYTYTFTPEGATKIEIAYPTIGEEMASYNGFGTEGVTNNGDGSFSVLLKEGRQIIRLTDASGNCTYQVFTAKPCHREITNASRPGSQIFQPGDKIKIQYSGLRHPANKLAGIYNMSAYVTYNGIPNGSSLILGSGQYTFGSAASAQAVTVDIPADYDIEEHPYIVMDHGVIQVKGYGDPIGNHRLISRFAGRSPNFTAIAHETYFGAIPDVSIPITAIKNFAIRTVCNVEGATIDIVFDGNSLTPNTDGTYTGSYGTYSVTASKDGFRFYRSTFTIADDAEGEQIVEINMTEAEENVWNGFAMTEPVQEGEIYQIATGAELAWFANTVTSGTNITASAVLTSEIDLGDYAWTPIGNNTSTKQFKGSFDGQGHSVKGLYVSGEQYQGLFGYANGATIKNIKVYGEVHGTANVGGVLGYSMGASVLDRLENHAYVTATTANSYVAGIVGRVNTATALITNCANYGTITGTNYVGGILNTTVAATVNNVINIGEIVGTQTGAIRGLNTATGTNGANITNGFAVKGYFNETKTTLVTAEQMASGEVAYLLGSAWGQEIGTDLYPQIGGMKVIKAGNQYVNSFNDIKDYELAVLSFEEDGWNALIDEPQYGGPLLYGEGMGFDTADEAYSWTDPVTKLHSTLSEAWGSYCYWSGGHAVSNYVSGDVETYGDSNSQLTVFKQGVSDLTQTGGGHNGSNNFAVHYGYADNSGWSLTEESLPSLSFADGIARVIDHMYVNNTCYAINCYTEGNKLTPNISKDDWVKIVATGYNGDKKTTTAEIYLCNGPENIVMDWTKFDLSALGAVTKITFNVTGSSDNGFGFSQPAYFAYDDVAVRMPIENLDIVLEDKSEYDLDHNLDVAKLTYARTFGTDMWQPLYVPFTSDYTDWKEDVIVAKAFDGNESTIVIQELADNEEVKANTPYFVKARETGDVVIVVDETTLVPAENGTYNCGTFSFTGVYAPMIINADSYSVLHKGAIVKTTNAYQLPSMRWYAETSAKDAKIEFIGSGETGIGEVNNLEFEIHNSKLYNLAGQRVGEDYSGIVIVNGKKFINKK